MALPNCFIQRPTQTRALILRMGLPDIDGRQNPAYVSKVPSEVNQNMFAGIVVRHVEYSYFDLINSLKKDAN